MNERGSITKWNEDKGFGFITPESGGERLFAHISAYAGRGRPALNRRVVYSRTKDEQGRLRAARFQYVGTARVRASVAPGVWLALLVAAVMMGGLVGLFLFGLVPVSLPGVYLAMSLATLLLYAMDKRAAEKGNRRVPEGWLHGAELLCGWPGALIGQQFFRHKTRKVPFQIGFWFCVALNLSALVWLLFYPEAYVLRDVSGFE